MPKIFDPKDVPAQIDVLRKHLRHWYSMHGPVPDELAAELDPGFEAIEAERLNKLAEAAEAKANAAADAAAAARAKAASPKAAAQSGGTAGVGDPPFKNSTRDPNAPKSAA